MAYERTSRRNIPQSMPLVCLGIPYNVAEYNTDQCSVYLHMLSHKSNHFYQLENGMIVML